MINKKVRPGAYISFKSERIGGFSIGERGTMIMPLIADWGKDGEIVELTFEDYLSGEYKNKIGDVDPLFIELAFKGCRKLLIYTINKGNKATATIGNNLTVTAKYGGVYGNNIMVGIKDNKVITEIDGVTVDEQNAEEIDDLINNDWVEFSGDGALSESAFTFLTGGSNSNTNADYDDFFLKSLDYTWQVMAITDKKMNDKAKLFIQNVRDKEGIKVQAVMVDDTADYEGIIKLKDQTLYIKETEVPAEMLTVYVSAITAGANINQSNTGKVTEFTRIKTNLLNSEIEKYLLKGYFLFTYNAKKQVQCEQDINSFTTTTDEKNKDFSKNRIIRAIDEINNTIKTRFDESYKGKVSNNDQGLTNLKADLVGYFNTLQAQSVIENFTPNDLDIRKGEAKDQVIARIAIMTVDSIEKLFLEVILK